ncbi:MAG: hypothetical protein JXB85_10460 [Anaerolineales bacterium]|nr:hypothetical protein [Anaerolineales bacterium]
MQILLTVSLSLFGLLFLSLFAYLLFGKYRWKGEATEHHAQLLAERKQHAVPARAVLIGRGRPEGGLFNRQANVDLHLRIMREGQEPYEAVTSWLVDLKALSRLQIKAELAVRVDTEDPRAVYPDEPWARIPLEE